MVPFFLLLFALSSSWYLWAKLELEIAYVGVWFGGIGAIAGFVGFLKVWAEHFPL